jgi:propanediol dehydratase large subunit
LSLRRRAVDALSAVFDELKLSAPTEDMKRSVVVASGSNETDSYLPRDVALISEAIKARGINVLDVIKALAARGFKEEAQNLLNVLRLRVSGDYLQTAAVVRNDRVISAVNNPNDYGGPGTGYRLTEQRRQELAAIRDVLTREEVLRTEATYASAENKRIHYKVLGPAKNAGPSNEIVIGISPAFGLKLFRTLAGHSLAAVLRALCDGIATKGGTARIVRMRHTADTSFLGLSAARLAGSGIGIGIQAKGTAVIHQADRLPHHNLELFSNSPITSLAHYRGFGENAASYAKGEMPQPVVVPTEGKAMGARYHAQVALIYAIETSLTQDDAKPEDVAIDFIGAQ